MHSKERVKFRVFSRNGLQPVVVIHRGGYFNSDKFYCLPDEVVTFDVGSQRWCANRRTNIQHCRINRVLLEKNPPLSLVITRSEIKYCGKIIDSSFRLCGWLCGWCYFPALGGSLPKIYWTNTSKFTGNYFQMAITVLIWFYLYKSLGIMMIKIHFEVYPLFVLDTRFCWKFSFSRKVTQHCASFDLAAATISTKRCT